METAAARHANKIDVKRDSKGPQSYAYGVVLSPALIQVDLDTVAIEFDFMEPLETQRVRWISRSQAAA
jgi:hypothetical protein